MKYRKLRIAWSVAWGVACLLLIALWVRSYSYKEQFCSDKLSNKHMIIVESAAGRVLLVYLPSNLWSLYWDHTGCVTELEGRHLGPGIRQLWLLYFALAYDVSRTPLAPGPLVCSPSHDSLAAFLEALQPPHAAHRHDRGSNRAGLGRLRAQAIIPIRDS